ncbi:hypothetical protein SKAU_G00384700 [Synaphobranchus kaupii]|uniref:Uncharacterized protein n=1 Tax=Synaphobranchus kaupii TaxID=118154 RepID=A0A9Q1EEE6_SYNKA|nr:hypothetical protein SKAU_G00384700 [Synaphobranchus kaupii]
MACLIYSERTMDLSLNDALTDGVVPQSASENLLQRDFVAALEAESFDDKVGETVGKTDYCPLMDKDGKKEGSGMMPAGQTPQNQDLQGDMWSFQTEQQVLNTDFLSGPVSMGGFPGQWGTQPMVPEMQATSLFTGFSQPGMEIMNMDVGMAPLSAERPPSMAEPQQPPSLFASEPPKLAQMPNKPNDQNPFGSPPDTTAGVPGDPWAGEGGLQTDLSFTPSDSTVISCHANEMADCSPEPLGVDECHQQSGGVGDERGSEGGGGRRQKKKKKRRQREEVYNIQESQDPQGENLSPTADYPGMEWELDEGGRIGGQGQEKQEPKENPRGVEFPPGAAPGTSRGPGCTPSRRPLVHERPVPGGAPPMTPSAHGTAPPLQGPCADTTMDTDMAPLPSDLADPPGFLQERGLVEKAIVRGGPLRFQLSARVSHKGHPCVLSPTPLPIP